MLHDNWLLSFLNFFSLVLALAKNKMLVCNLELSFIILYHPNIITTGCIIFHNNSFTINIFD